jgi:hypothetical protein
VRLAGLVQVKPQARRDKSHWWRIQAKCVDFVLCDARTTPRLVIELDDSSHKRTDRQAARVRSRSPSAYQGVVALMILEGSWSFNSPGGKTHRDAIPRIMVKPK